MYLQIKSFKHLSHLLINLLLLSTTTSSLLAQEKAIKLKAEFHINGDSLQLTVYSIGHQKVASNLYIPTRNTKIKNVMKDGKCYQVAEVDYDTSYNLMGPDDAAVTFFEMLMTHPQSHFNKANKDHLQSLFFTGYKVEIVRNRSGNPDIYNERIKSATLSKNIENGDSILLRRIEILEYQKSRSLTYVPLKTEIFDGDLESIAKIEIISYQFEETIPNFIFEVPELGKFIPN